jgi:alcohol dehydrogenase class IV
VGYRGNDPAGAVADLIQRISDIRRQLRVPESYSAAGVPEGEYHARIKNFATRALTFPATVVNPRKPTLEELETLFKACFNGDYGLL